MIILSIETSCDDTGIGLLKGPNNRRKSCSYSDFELLTEAISSQAKLHSKYGGVFPALAKREHQKNLIPLLKKSLRNAGMLKKNRKTVNQDQIKKIKVMLARNQELFEELNKFLEEYQVPEVDKLAVTVGPGLEPCLWTGINLARALSYYSKIPIIGVNHIEGHVLANWLKPIEDVSFPAIALVVSGGNTQIILMKGLGKYEIIGETRDDAAGECFDKTARMLGLPYPGGPNISKKAESFKKNGEEKYSIALPRPMIHEKNYDFSFSGLKTAVLYDLKKRNSETLKDESFIEEMCYKIEEAIIDVLVKKTLRAFHEFSAHSLIIGGGVSGNKELIKSFKKEAQKNNIKLFYPLPAFSGDNPAMIALSALISPKPKTISWQKIKPNPNLRIDE